MAQRITTLLTALALAWPVSAPAQDDFPVTIDHAFGTTTIDQRPERVATIAWSNHEVPLSLGVVPVGFAKAGFGDDDGDGVLPWVEARLTALDAERPTLFDEGDGIDFEAVAETDPDVILAAYSGISQADYDILSQIAPVVAYPEGPWTAGWRETIRFDSAGMGRAADGDALIAEIEARIAETAAANPVLDGKSVVFITHLDARDLSVIGFYTDADARLQLLAELGMTAPAVTVAEDGAFFGEISAERIDRLADVDVIVTYGSDDLLQAMRDNPLTARIKAVRTGSVVTLPDGPIGAAANPSPLSMDRTLGAYTDLVVDAARKAE